MKKLLLILATALTLVFVGCADIIESGPYSINGSIQKGPFVQGSIITIQTLNVKLKPTGQAYTTLTINDAGLFEIEDIASRHIEIMANGYYFDEVEGKVSAAPLVLRSIADLNDSSQTNVNILTTLTYDRIKSLVNNDKQNIEEARKQAETELFSALGIPTELHPTIGCASLNIASSENSDANGLLLAISAIVQEGRSVGELSEYISKFSADLADDGAVAQTLLEKFNLDGGHFRNFETKIIENLQKRYRSLGVECNIPNFVQYLPFFVNSNSNNNISFTYDEEYLKECEDLYGKDGFLFVSIETDQEVESRWYENGIGIISFVAAPTTVINCTSSFITSVELPETITSLAESAFVFMGNPKMAQFKGKFASEDGRCLIYNGVLNSCAAANLTEYIIPSEVHTIGSFAFDSCTTLTSVTIPDGVHTIAHSAFGGTGITEIIMPNSVTSIEQFAFCRCEQLERVTLSKNISHIDNCAFLSGKNLVELYCPCITPPTLNGNYPLGSYTSGRTIYVPQESVETYKNAQEWKKYADFIVGYDFD